MTIARVTPLEIHPDLINLEAQQNAQNTAQKPKSRLEAHCGRIGGLLEAEVLRQKQAEDAQARAKSGQDDQKDSRILISLLSSQLAIDAILACCKDSKISHEIYPNALLAVLDKMQLGEPANMTELYAIKVEGMDISVNFIRQKIKPLLIDLGLLVALNEKSYRWLNRQELNLIDKKHGALTLMNHLIDSPFIRFCRLKLIDTPIDTVNRHVVSIEKKRAAKNPYIKLNQDGTARKIRKPFTGELSEEEKKAIRAADKEKAFKKFTNGEGLSLEVATEIQKIREKAALEIAQKQAQWDKNKESARQYLSIVAVIALVLFIVTSCQNSPEVTPKSPKQQALGL